MQRRPRTCGSRAKAWWKNGWANNHRLLALGCAVCLLTGAGFGTARGQAEDPLPQYAQELTGWAVYWDVEQTLDEMEALGAHLRELVLFGAYYDENTRLFIPDELGTLREEALAMAEGTPPLCYLSIINDQLLEDGGAVQKDPELLYRLLDDPDKRTKHVREILDLAGENGYDAVEIDYEAMRKDEILWTHFAAFIEELWAEASRRDLPVRILLEPGAPLDQVALPEGPQYVLMCYNLYGYHSGPGPKADKAFLIQMVEKMRQVPGETAFALAGGGFDWTEGGGIRDLTTRTARELAMQHQVRPQRDEASGALFFFYEDEEGATHEVWYADRYTLDAWRQTVLDAGGQRTNLWRLGGNDLHVTEAEVTAFFDGLSQ